MRGTRLKARNISSPSPAKVIKYKLYRRSVDSRGRTREALNRNRRLPPRISASCVRDARASFFAQTFFSYSLLFPGRVPNSPHRFIALLFTIVHVVVNFARLNHVLRARQSAPAKRAAIAARNGREERSFSSRPALRHPDTSPPICPASEKAFPGRAVLF